MSAFSGTPSWKWTGGGGNVEDEDDAIARGVAALGINDSGGGGALLHGDGGGHNDGGPGGGALHVRALQYNVLAAPYTKYMAWHHRNGYATKAKTGGGGGAAKPAKTVVPTCESGAQTAMRYGRAAADILRLEADVVALQECSGAFFETPLGAALRDRYDVETAFGSVDTGVAILVRKGGRAALGARRWTSATSEPKSCKRVLAVELKLRGEDKEEAREEDQAALSGGGAEGGGGDAASADAGGAAPPSTPTTTVWAVSLHAPHRHESKPGVGRAERIAATKALLDGLDAAPFGDGARVLVLGDFNMDPSSTPNELAALQAATFLAPLALVPTPPRCFTSVYCDPPYRFGIDCDLGNDAPAYLLDRKHAMEQAGVALRTVDHAFVGAAIAVVTTVVESNGIPTAPWNPALPAPGIERASDHLWILRELRVEPVPSRLGGSLQ